MEAENILRENAVTFDNTRLPGLLIRIQALFIDFVLILALYIAFSYFFDLLQTESKFLRAFVSIFLTYLYDPFFVSISGSTIGHKVMGLTVKQFDSPTENISFFSAAWRFTVKAMLGWLSFLTVTTNKNNRAIHDIASGSILLISR